MALPEKEEEVKWKGKATVKIKNATAEQVWPLLADFCNVHKCIPVIHTCYLVEGVNGEPGAIRYAAISPPEGSTEMIHWGKERLLEIDPIQKTFSYELLENNIGLKSYVAYWKVLPSDNDEGCEIEWSYVSDPVDGMYSGEDLLKFLDSDLQGMAEVLEKQFESTSIST